MRPFERKRELLCTIPGVAERTAEVILAEFGADMSRFPSHRHAASWAAICPGNAESAGSARPARHALDRTAVGDRVIVTVVDRAEGKRQEEDDVREARS
jgi:transposase